ncbi:Smr/MutS family protein [Desulfurivibrio sp. D14AmB]|uniref:Smr/MutS family protein n=1 Tax=Desulfurivibrio sp. D14AmB TaxID=3374370 RepID=UPI00376EAEE0
MKKNSNRSGFAFAAVVEHYLPDQAGARAPAADQHEHPSLAARFRSYPPPQEELDLHGLTAEEAEKAIRRFVVRCREIRLTTLRIITGKGLHSPGQPVLPGVAEATLEELKR